MQEGEWLGVTPWHFYAIGSIAVIILGVWAVYPYTTVARESVVLAFAPSAQRAYEYGERHFSAKNPNEYDIDRAEYLYDEAYRLDPNLPYVQHQRARIAFLKGDFARALDLINVEIESHPSPSSYYVRGLIKGYMDDFDGAAADYEMYLKTDPYSWAALNDYAWVLLKGGRTKDALVAVEWGLMTWPENPWLLNSAAIAHYELGQIALAKELIDQAVKHVESVGEAEWRKAYPGNDPLIATEGIEALQGSVRENMHTISLAIENATSSMR